MPSLPSEAPQRRRRRRRRRRIRVPTIPAAIHSACRFLGWLTSLVAIVMMAYIIKCWPTVTGAISASLVGMAIALLNDSWEMIAHIDPTDSFKPLNPPRVVLHDLFSLAVCMGGLLLILFADIREEHVAEQSGDNFDDEYETKRRYITIGQWLLAAVAIWRFIFAIWGGCHCTRQRRSVRNRDGPETASVPPI